MANIEELKNKINIVDYVKSLENLGKATRSGNGNLYKNCPICKSQSKGKSSTDNGHFYMCENTQSYSSFSSCCKGGDIINFIMEYYKVDNKEAINRLYEITNTPKDDFKPNIQPVENKLKPVENIETEAETKQSKEQQQTNENFVNDNLDISKNDEIISYLESRGIKNNTKEIAIKTCMFMSDKYYNKEDTKRLYIPVFEDRQITSFVGRRISDDESKPRYQNSRGGIGLFNIDLIKSKPETNKQIYITEGIFDALSIMQYGKNAIAINSTSNKTKLIKAIKDNIETAKEYIYFICTDNDKSGQDFRKAIKEGLKDSEIILKDIYIPDKYNDVNEFIQADERYFKSYLIDDPLQDNISTYLTSSFVSDIQENLKNKERKTGFKILDENLRGLNSGLYVIGAISSLGKTTLVHQIVEQMAEQGEKVLFFSLEQSKFELVSKGLSRQNAILNIQKNKNLKEAVGVYEIMNNPNIEKDFKDEMTRYIPIANNMKIYEGNFKTNVKTIREEVDTYIKLHEKKPVVVLDYLQILTPTEEIERAPEKQQIDFAVSELKRISRDYNIPVIVISSFNRDNYNTSVNLSSFKESGGIEYTADVILGLQLSVINDLKVTRNVDNKKENDEMINNAKNKSPREVELVCLKNRSGKPYFKIAYNFFAKNNLFVEVTDTTNKQI